MSRRCNSLAGRHSISPVNKPGARDGGFTPAFTPDQAQIAYADAKWVVWITSETPDRDLEIKKRAQRRLTRYFRQKLNSRDATQIFEMSGTYSRRVYAVLDDGTVLLLYEHDLVWAFPDGRAQMGHHPLAQRHRPQRGNVMSLCGGLNRRIAASLHRRPEFPQANRITLAHPTGCRRRIEYRDVWR